jgi:hypothetical protein
MSTYIEWNQLLADSIFTFEKSQHPVFIDLDASALEELVEKTGLTLTEIIADVSKALLEKSTPDSKFLKNIQDDVLKWRRNDSDTNPMCPPPVLPVLLLASAAAENMGEGEVKISAYYVHLMRILELDDTLRKRVEKNFRDHIELFFDALNDWLVGIGGVRGTPTAQRLGRGQIALPMSQALIRTGDRDRLYLQLDREGIEPYNSLSNSDVEILTNSWLRVSNSGFTSMFKALLQSGEYRSRMIELIRDEIEAWDGSVPLRGSRGSGETNVVRGKLVATWKRESIVSKSIVFSLTAPLAPIDAPEGLRLNGSAGEDLFQLVPFGQNASKIEGPRRLSTESLLSANLRFSQTNGVSVERRAKPIVVLTMEELSGSYKEKDNVQLGRDSMFLVRNSSAELVHLIREYLKINALQSYRELSSQEFPWVPEGWLIFDSIQLLQCTPVPSSNFRNYPELVSTEETVLILEGGLKVPGLGKTWLLESAPRLTALSDKALMSLRLLKNGEQVDTWRLLGEPGLDALGGRITSAGLYRVELNVGVDPNPSRTLNFAIVEGKSSHPGRLSPKRICYEFETHSSSRMFGGRMVVDFESPKYSGTPHIPPKSELPPSEPFARRVIEQSKVSELPPEQSNPLACVNTGSHKWHLETAERRVTDSEGQCEFCHRKKTFRGKLVDPTAAVVRKNLEETPDRNRFAYQVTNLFGTTNINDGFDFDVAKAAFQFMGYGSSAELQSICSQTATKAGLHWRNVADEAFMKSLIDFEINDNGQIENWAAVEPMKLEYDFGVLEINTGKGEVPTVRSGPEYAMELLSMLPNLSNIAGDLKKINAPSARSIAKFDYSSLSWIQVEYLNGEGVYQFRTATGNVYGLAQDALAESDTLVTASPSLLKWIGGKEIENLLSYNPEGGIVLLPLGFQAPGLFSRALYLAAGKDPRRVSIGSQAFLAFDSIPEDFATMLYSKMRF